jgi:hypothetical protein
MCFRGDRQARSSISLTGSVAGTNAKGRAVQLSWLCPCGQRPVELKGLCRLCYHRRYHSLRFFGGLHEAVLKRDRSRCRNCGSGAPLVVHHRNGDNEQRLLITLCIGCHVRLHRYRGLNRWLPKALLELWREVHPGQPLQMQLDLSIRSKPAPTPPLLSRERLHAILVRTDRLPVVQKPT